MLSAAVCAVDMCLLACESLIHTPMTTGVPFCNVPGWLARLLLTCWPGLFPHLQRDLVWRNCTDQRSSPRRSSWVTLASVDQLSVAQLGRDRRCANPKTGLSLTCACLFVGHFESLNGSHHRRGADQCGSMGADRQPICARVHLWTLSSMLNLGVPTAAHSGRCRSSHVT